MRQADAERRIRQLVWPVPSDDLRRRVLASVPGGHEPITWSDRIWFSRGWRFAGAAAAIAAIAVASMNSTMASDTPGVTAEARTSAEAVTDTGRALGLPPELCAALAQRTLAAPGAPADQAAMRALDDLVIGERR